jgi:hypothetical protein
MNHKVEEYAVGVLVIGRSEVRPIDGRVSTGRWRGFVYDEEVGLDAVVSARTVRGDCLGRGTDLNTVVDLSMNSLRREQIRDRNHALCCRDIARKPWIQSRWRLCGGILVLNLRAETMGDGRICIPAGCRIV